MKTTTGARYNMVLNAYVLRWETFLTNAATRAANRKDASLMIEAGKQAAEAIKDSAYPNVLAQLLDNHRAAYARIEQAFAPKNPDGTRKDGKGTRKGPETANDSRDDWNRLAAFVQYAPQAEALAYVRRVHTLTYWHPSPAINHHQGIIRAEYRRRFDADPLETVERCGRCGGSGVYRGAGHVENGVFKGYTGDCFRCGRVGTVTLAQNVRGEVGEAESALKAFAGDLRQPSGKCSCAEGYTCDWCAATWTGQDTDPDAESGEIDEDYEFEKWADAKASARDGWQPEWAQ